MVWNRKRFRQVHQADGCVYPADHDQSGRQRIDIEKDINLFFPFFKLNLFGLLINKEFFRGYTFGELQTL